MKQGIAVRCAVCGMTKQPHGRSAPFGSFYCADDCSGYDQDPKPGCLWPGETAVEFGYAVCDNATREVNAAPIGTKERV